MGSSSPVQVVLGEASSAKRYSVPQPVLQSAGQSAETPQAVVEPKPVPQASNGSTQPTLDQEAKQSILVKVLRADNLRWTVSGEKPSAAVFLRIGQGMKIGHTFKPDYIRITS